MIQRPVLLLLALALLPAGCSGPGAPRSGTPPRPTLDAAVPPSPAGTAPSPYTAAQIAECHPLGTFTEYRITSPGRPAVRQRTEWTAVSAEGCEMAMTTLGPDGLAVGEPERAEALWWQLRDHAAFPEARVEVSDARVTTEAGAFDCLLYEVRAPADGTAPTMRLWFDRASAGSPVLFTTEAGGQETMRMELVAMNRPPRSIHHQE